MWLSKIQTCKGSVMWLSKIQTCKGSAGVLCGCPRFRPVKVVRECSVAVQDSDL